MVEKKFMIVEVNKKKKKGGKKMGIKKSELPFLRHLFATSESIRGCSNISMLLIHRLLQLLRSFATLVKAVTASFIPHNLRFLFSKS